MVWKTHDYDDIPGTYVFDGRRSHKGYALNRLAFSFNNEENRLAFSEDPDAYCRGYGLTDKQREAVLATDFLTLLHEGGNIYYLAKMSIHLGLSMQDAGASFQGIETETFKANLQKSGEGFEQKLEKLGGYWHG